MPNNIVRESKTARWTFLLRYDHADHAKGNRRWGLPHDGRELNGPAELSKCLDVLTQTLGNRDHSFRSESHVVPVFRRCEVQDFEVKPVRAPGQ